jgi:hypothetical protein
MRKGTAVVAVALVLATTVGSAACSPDDGGTATEAPTGGDVAGEATSSTSTTAAPAFTSTVVALTAADAPSSWRPGCPVAVEDLRAIDASHWGFDGTVHEGRIVVAEPLVDDVTGVLRELFDARYPIERMEPVDAYGGDDLASIAANNTSAFNCRLATGSTSSWSEHAYGRAIDLNPLVNPYVVGDEVIPEVSRPYLDRTRTDQGMIHEGDAAVVAFESRGWVWGGHWRASKDYQHFSTTGR